MPKVKLTEAQNRAWQMILGYFGQFGNVPSNIEIAECLEMTRQGAHEIVGRLIAKGYLIKNAKGIKIKN